MVFIIFSGLFVKKNPNRLWMYTKKNWTRRAKESLNRNLMRLSEQLLELVSVFKEASKTSFWLFSKTKQAKNLKTICACQESTDLILYAFKENHALRRIGFGSTVSTPVSLTPASIGERLPAAHWEEKKSGQWTFWLERRHGYTRAVVLHAKRDLSNDVCFENNAKYP